MLTRLNVMLARLRAWLHSDRLDDEFADELQAHLALLTEDNIRRGMSSAEAARAARIRLGGAAQLREHHRGLRGIPLLDTMIHDIRYAARALARTPMYTFVAVVTLGLGIGVNTTVFSIYNAVALRRLPVRDSENLFRLERWFGRTDGVLYRGPRGNIQYLFSYPEYLYYREQCRALSSVVAASWPIHVSADRDTLAGQLVSENYFSELGIRPAAGRLLDAGDNGAPGAHPVIVLSHPFWEARFDSDPRAIGSTLRLSHAPFTIVGVTPADFPGTGNPPQVPDFWAPLMMQAALDPTADWLHQEHVYRLELLARIAPQIPLTQAEAALTLLAGQRSLDPARERDGVALERTAAITMEHATLFGETNDPRFRAFVALVMAIVALVLLTACGNLANMVVARATTRQREIGVRLALGASRARVMSQLLVENIILGLIGGAAGLVLSTWSCRWLWAASIEAIQDVVAGGVPRTISLDPDLRVFAYTAGLSIVAAILFGLAPALQFSRANPTCALKDQSSGAFGSTSRSRRRQVLIACQVTISVALLISAGLLARGVVRGQSTSPGFETRSVFTVEFNRGPDPRRSMLVQRRVFEAVRPLAGIGSAAFVRWVPLRNTWTAAIDVGGSLAHTCANRVSPEYFEMLGIPFERGRGFSAEEAERGAPVAIVSEAGARQLWPGTDPIGRRLRIDVGVDRRGQFSDVEVIGIVGDVRSANISRLDPSYVYLPIEADRPSTLLVRTEGDPRTALSKVRDAIDAVDRNLGPSVHIVSLEEGPLRAQKLLPQALATSASVFAVLALVLSAVGIYGVVSYLVSQRTHEIGVRMALGARPRDVLRLIVGQGLRPVLAGMAAGALGAAVISSLLHAAVLMAPSAPDLTSGVGAFDPVTYTVLLAMVAGIAILASSLPARRAMAVDPLVALRYE